MAPHPPIIKTPRTAIVLGGLAGYQQHSTSGVAAGETAATVGRDALAALLGRLPLTLGGAGRGAGEEGSGGDGGAEEDAGAVPVGGRG